MHIVFDLDGVVTSEQTYWNTVSTVLGKLFRGSHGDPEPLPLRLIAQIKSRAINSNWDLGYVVLCCHVLAQSRKNNSAHSSAATGFGDLLNSSGEPLDFDETGRLLREVSGEKGFALLKALGAEVDQKTSSTGMNFAFGGSAYHDLHARCQKHHDEKFEQGVPEEKEEPVVDLSSLRTLLTRIGSEPGVSLGIATGRTRKEATRALNQFGIHQFFERDRIVCYDDVLAAEGELSPLLPSGSLAKPNPYSILRTVWPAASVHDLVSRKHETLTDVIYVGDGVSDVLAAKSAGAYSIGVLTGVPDIGDFRNVRRGELLAAGCDSIAPTVLDLDSALHKL